VDGNIGKWRRILLVVMLLSRGRIRAWPLVEVTSAYRLLAELHECAATHAQEQPHVAHTPGVRHTRAPPHTLEIPPLPLAIRERQGRERER
jgi:hypothetical protein